jgi:hypothetical protein
MDYRPLRRVYVVLALVLACLPRLASAQSAVAGQVHDNTGAVLPGVSVEVTSPTLIEGSRSVNTDGQGRYSVVNLRPGVYTVTFSLQGFNKVVRQEVDVPANFTATIDATMSIGAVSETVTVTGASPIVDVQQAERTQVFSRDALDSLSTSRNIWSTAILASGVTINAPDVGGTANAVDKELVAHGTTSHHSVYTVDGLMVNTIIDDGRAQNYFQDLANEEVTVRTTGGGTAEFTAGGVHIDMIPRDGGNTFHGQGYLGGTAGSWQSNNLTPRLKNLGVLKVEGIDRIFDFGVSEGGRIVRDRLWFAASARYYGTYNYVLDTFKDDGSQYRAEGKILSLVPRLTYQVTPKNKVVAHFDLQYVNRGPVLTPKYPPVVNGRGGDPETTNTRRDPSVPNYTNQVKWMSVVSSRLLVEAGFGKNFQPIDQRPMPGIIAAVGTPEWFSRIPKTDLDLGTTWNARLSSLTKAYRSIASGSVSYVTGSHKVKVGLQDSWGLLTQDITSNGHINAVQYRSGVPTAVVVGNYPVNTSNRLDRDLGVFAQDQWTLRRLTVSAGIRGDWVEAKVDKQTAESGRFVGARSFSERSHLPNWSDISPRLGLSYDLFGDAKTALKFSLGKYLRPQATSLAQRFNPMAAVTTTIPWNDRDLLGRSLASNGDDIPQDNELDLSRLPTNFGQRQLDTLDQNLEREFNVETSVSLQHELMPNVSVSGGWYHRSFGNFALTDNRQRDFSDYVPVQVISPYNGEVITAYNLRSATELSLIDNFVTNAGEERSQVYDGFDLGLQARLPGGLVFGSINTQRMISNECDEVDDPNKLRFCDRGDLPDLYKAVPWLTDFKLAGNYSLPFGFQVSGSFVSQKDLGRFLNGGFGLPINWLITRTTTYSASDCAKANGPCTPGALVIPGLVESSLTIPLAPAGTERFFPRLNQLDFGVKKEFNVSGARWQARLDIFNALNSDAWFSERSANYGTPAFGLPGGAGLAYIGAQSMLSGRIPRLSLQVKW